MRQRGARGRDSKNPGTGVLVVGGRSAEAFLAAVKSGRLDG
ncbi:uncharacterized protein DUF397 [Saccharothrix texasensis]|uniref:Uncharacterized protein DUF397 n=1 Tax=Saccharothrix texasensis TaxID=103734 RepID=A0A3N1H7R1_9PSEU|nr:uncharacterized protein DUF397 [Saccharothrix texasensis]